MVNNWNKDERSGNRQGNHSGQMWGEMVESKNGPDYESLEENNSWLIISIFYQV